jgi:hypothetical protein
MQTVMRRSRNLREGICVCFFERIRLCILYTQRQAGTPLSVLLAAIDALKLETLHRSCFGAARLLDETVAAGRQ